MNIRWMIRRDMPAVLDIEFESFEYPWPEAEFIHYQRQRNSTCIVAERDDKIVGYMIYELHKTRLQLLNFAVACEHRRRGIGREMIACLTGKLSEQRRSRVIITVSEANTVGHLFLKACGFRAVNVVKDLYEDSDEDAYLFSYRYRPAEKVFS